MTNSQSSLSSSSSHPSPAAERKDTSAAGINPVMVVAAHKPFAMPDDPLYLPVQAGALNRESIGFVRDDAGDNLSAYNSMLSELTVLYWAWKNLPESVSAYGLVHYRRYFKGDVPIEGYKVGVLSKQKAEALLENHPIIVPKKRHYYIETLASHYAHTHQESDLLLLKDVLRDVAPEALEPIEKVLARRSGHMFNIFLMKREYADAFCSFLFPIVEEICRRADLDDTSPFLRRMPGRLGEFLLDVWLEMNHLNAFEYPVADIEPVNWLKKGTAFLKAKFFSHKYDSSF